MHSSDEGKIAAIQNAWRATIKAGESVIPCPVCYHPPQLRRHVFTGTMALALVHLHHRGAPVSEDSMPEVVKTGESLKKLVLWGLAFEKDGRYWVAQEGHEVLQRATRVRRYCITGNGAPLWFEGEERYIDETLNQSYSFDALMKEPA